MKKLLSILLVLLILFSACMISAFADTGISKIPPVLEKKLKSLCDDDTLIVDVYANTADQYERYDCHLTIIDKLGVRSIDVLFISRFDTYVILKLTKSQIYLAAQLNEVMAIREDNEDIPTFEPTQKISPMLEWRLELLGDDDALIVDVYANTADQYERYDCHRTIINKLEVKEENVLFISRFDTYIILNLTKKQILDAAKLDEVQFVAESYDAPDDVQPTEQPVFLLGDADGDGCVTIVDATAIQRHLAELTTKAYIEAAADADGDGIVNIMDATVIQRHIAELPTHEGIGEPMN